LAGISGLHQIRKLLGTPTGRLNLLRGKKRSNQSELKRKQINYREAVTPGKERKTERDEKLPERYRGHARLRHAKGVYLKESKVGGARLELLKKWGGSTRENGAACKRETTQTEEEREVDTAFGGLGGRSEAKKKFRSISS